MKQKPLKKNEVFKDLYTRMQERLGGASAITEVAQWLCDNTNLAGKPWSFKDHEFQIAICNSTKPHVVVQKPTQVGMTELSFRLALALCAIRQHFGLIYVFPSAVFAAEQSKMRVDPIIEQSSKLSALMVPGANSSMSKRIGTSAFYMGGAASKTQAISRPVQALVFDEKDFCNQTVLTAYHGRLRHVLEQDRIIREFSTPTVADYGINESLELSSKQRYLVKCTHCGKRHAPDFKSQVTIPGYNKDSFEFFSKDDLNNPQLEVDKAYLRCEKCGKDLFPALIDAATREWVETYEGRSIEGFAVKPFDLPKYNSIPSLVRAFGNYSDETDYWNFVQGEVHQSTSNQVDLDIARSCFIIPFHDDDAKLDGAAIGIDVGNTYCYAVAGRRVVDEGATKTVCYWRKRYSLSDGEFLPQILKDVQSLQIISGAMDIQPDGTLSRGFRDHNPDALFAASYRRDVVGSLEYYSADPEDGVFKIQRTKGFNLLVKEINDRKWLFSLGPDKETFVSHLGGMKRVSQQDETGEITQQWVKIGSREDHYLHACMYLKAALDRLDQPNDEIGEPVLPTLSGIGIGIGIGVGRQKQLRPAVVKSGMVDQEVVQAAKLLGIV